MLSEATGSLHRPLALSIFRALVLSCRRSFVLSCLRAIHDFIILFDNLNFFFYVFQIIHWYNLKFNIFEKQFIFLVVSFSELIDIIENKI